MAVKLRFIAENFQRRIAASVGRLFYVPGVFNTRQPDGNEN